MSNPVSNWYNRSPPLRIYVCTAVDSHVELIEFDKLFWETNPKKANTFYCDITVPELNHNCIVV